MNPYRTVLIIARFVALALLPWTGRGAEFTSDFLIEECHFSPFGGHPHFVLDPGHQLTLKGEDDGEVIELTITALDRTREIRLPGAGGPRRILARVIEEREFIDGELYEVSRNWYARCVETGDIYYFGEEVDFYEDGEIVNHAGSWEAGINGAKPGIIMPGSFLLGARYFQELAPGAATDQGENIGMGLSVTTPAGTFERCVQVREHNPLEPGSDPSIKTYAPGIGMIEDDALKLTSFHLGKTDGLPGGCTFEPFSSHPYFPFSPGRKLTLEGREDGEEVTLIITVLDELRQFTLPVGGAPANVQTRVIEERESVDGELAEVSRNFFAQCVETGDVYYFGEEVDYYEDGEIVSHGGAWVAGVNGARPGIIMPGHFTVGARYFQEQAPGLAEDFAVNSAVRVTMTTPAGTFTNCVSVTESNPLEPDSEPEVKTYAPGIGLINDADVLKLTSVAGAGGVPVLSIQDTILLAWPLSDAPLLIERSPDLKNWTPLGLRPQSSGGRHQISLPQSAASEFFRLTPP